MTISVIGVGVSVVVAYTKWEMWRKHRVTKFSLWPVIGVFLLTTVLSGLSALFLPAQKAYAADYSPSQQATAWNVGMGMANCSRDAGWEDNTSAGDLEKGGVFLGSTDLNGSLSDTKKVGIIAEKNDGVINCAKDADISDLVGASGFKPKGFLTEFAGIYKLSSDKSEYVFDKDKHGSGDDGDTKAAAAIKSAIERRYGFKYGDTMPEDMQYAALLAAFNSKCQRSRDAQGIEVFKVKSDGTIEKIKYSLKLGDGDTVKVGYGIAGTDEQEMTCKKMVAQMNKFADAYSKTIKANVADSNPNNDAATDGGTDGLSDNNPTCETSGNPASWFLCPIFNGVAELSDWLFRNMVEPLLRTAPVSTDPDNGSFKVWSSFRLYGNIILLISMLVIVFGQAIGGGLVDAYTAKKVMPRIFIAALLVNVSIYIVALLVDVTNILGAGIGQLMTAPFGDNGQFSFSLTGAQSIVIGGGTIVAFLAGILFVNGAVLASFAPFIGVFILLPAVVGILGAFLTLIIRQGIILALTLLSPVAFALYCLPNTEQYFKKWWSALFKALLVYPIVIIMFAVADIMAITIQEANGFGGGPLLTQTPTNIMAGIIAFVAMFLPLVMIPWAFKMAGGLIGGLVTTLSKFGKQGTEFIKGNANDPNSRRNKAKSRLGQEAGRRTSDFVHFAEGRAGADTMFKGRMRRGVAKGAGTLLGKYTNADLSMARANKREAEESEEISASGIDDYRFAAAGFQWNGPDHTITDSQGNTMSFETGQYYNSKGKKISKQLYTNAKRWQGRTMNEVGTQLEYTARKAKTDLQHAALRIALSENARAGGWGQDGLAATQAQAMYPHKGTGSHQWFSKVEMQPDGSVVWHDVSEDSEKGNSGFDDMVSEHGKMMQAYQLGAIQDGTWRVYESRQRQLESKLAANNYSDMKDASGKTITAAAQRQKDVDRLAATYELVDAATMEQTMLTPGDKGGEAKISASGASAASQPILRRMREQRQYEFGTDTADGARQVVTKKDDAGNQFLVGQSYTTGGDVARSAIPRVT